MRQQTLAAQASFEKYGRKSKREQFLDAMEQVVPWRELQALVEPHYPKGEKGRPPVGLEIMLRVYFLQQWFNLSDPGAEEALGNWIHHLSTPASPPSSNLAASGQVETARLV